MHCLMLRMSLRLLRISYLAEVDMALFAATAVLEPTSHTDEDRFVELVAKSLVDMIRFLARVIP